MTLSVFIRDHGLCPWHRGDVRHCNGNGVNLNNLIHVPTAASLALNKSRRTRNLQLFLVNPSSVGNKTAGICDYLIATGVDIVLMTETWLTFGDVMKRVQL